MVLLINIIVKMCITTMHIPVDTALRGTTGDWEPEDGLCPLVVSGDAWPRLRASIISRKLRGTGGVSAACPVQGNGPPHVRSLELLC